MWGMTMQAHDPDPSGGLLKGAVVQALADARWERLDLLARRPAVLVPDLLTARGDELAASPRGQDQLLAIALERVARGETPGPGVEDLLGPAPTEAERLELRRAAASARNLPVNETRDFVELLVARHQEPGRRRPALVDALEAEANMNELLWDDPRLRADAGVRLVMLGSVMKLRDRIDHLRGLPARMAGVAARLPLVGSFLRSLP